LTPNIISPEARQDIRDIRKYYLKVADVRVARHVIEAIEQACMFVGRNPAAGHIRPHLTSNPLKFWQVFSYLVVYDPVTRPIQIVRILHTSRDLKALLGES
jgi:antitoxin ParD1/3/4/toxin ParE1/3/4